MTAPSVTVIVLSWNDREATRACIRSLAATDYENLHIIIVDNNSTDGSLEDFAGDDRIDLVRNPVNLGFTGGVNAGIRRAMEKGADYVWLLNSDATTGPDVLGRLVATAETDARIGLVSPAFYDPATGTPEWCLSRFDPASRIAGQTADPAVARAWQELHPDQTVLVGTALLIRRALIEAIGVLDEQFFAYVEDVDYSLRATAAGFRNVAVPDAVVYHPFKKPVENPDGVPAYLHYFMTRNYLLLWRKLPGRGIASKPFVWFLRERLMQVTRMKANATARNALLAGLWDGLNGKGGAYDPSRRMPAPLRFLLGRYPEVWINLIDRRIALWAPIRK